MNSFDNFRMNHCDVKSEENDLFNEFMDLEEFIDASTTDVASPNFSQSSFDSYCSPEGSSGVETLNKSDTKAEQSESLNLKENGSTSENGTDDNQGMVASPDGNMSTGNMVRDQRYWDRRLKNNIAAKRSRDAKRLKETTVVKRWTFLEEENKRLKEQISNMQRRLNAASGGSC